MTKPNFFENLVCAAQWPVKANGDQKNYFIFQILDNNGYANQVFYRDMALHGAADMIETVAKAFVQKRRLKIYLSDPSNMLVDRVELGPPA